VGKFRLYARGLSNYEAGALWDRGAVIASFFLISAYLLLSIRYHYSTLLSKLTAVITLV